MIEGLYHVMEIDSKKFTDLIIRAVTELQSKNLKVEIQYSSVIKGNIDPKVTYSALIVGRKVV